MNRLPRDVSLSLLKGFQGQTRQRPEEPDPISKLILLRAGDWTGEFPKYRLP